MALSTVVTSLDGLDESVKGLYVEKDGAFVLDITGVDDHPEVKGLKGAYQAEQGKRRDAKDAADESERKRKELEDETAKKQGEFKSLYEKTLAERDEERERSVVYRKKVEGKDISLALTKIAAELTDSAHKRDDIIFLYKQFAIVTDDGVKFEIGGVPVDAQKIKEMVTNDRPYLVDGSKANGGGAGGGGGAVTKKWADLTENERDELFNSDVDTYRKLRDAEK